MKFTTVDRETVLKLAQLGEKAEIRDESGKVVGYYEPVMNSTIDVPFSDEELVCREAEKVSYTTQEVLSYLQGMDKIVRRIDKVFGPGASDKLRDA